MADASNAAIAYLASSGAAAISVIADVDSASIRGRVHRRRSRGRRGLLDAEGQGPLDPPLGRATSPALVPTSPISSRRSDRPRQIPRVMITRHDVAIARAAECHRLSISLYSRAARSKASTGVQGATCRGRAHKAEAI